jgi:hypothetical protein
MGTLRRKESRIVTGPMVQGGAPASEDRQVELARRYRPDGSLEAERYRLRVRTSAGGCVSQSGASGGGLTFIQTLGGVLYVLAWPLGLWWITGSLWGAAVGIVIVAAHLAAQPS